MLNLSWRYRVLQQLFGGLSSTFFGWHTPVSPHLTQNWEILCPESGGNLGSVLSLSCVALYRHREVLKWYLLRVCFTSWNLKIQLWFKTFSVRAKARSKYFFKNFYIWYQIGNDSSLSVCNMYVVDLEEPISDYIWLLYSMYEWCYLIFLLGRILFEVLQFDSSCDEKCDDSLMWLQLLHSYSKCSKFVLTWYSESEKLKSRWM